jgi:hypothetical protein
MFEDTKLTRNESLFMFFMANDASDGMFGLSAMICSARSLIESMTAANSLSPFLGSSSGNSETVAFR